MKYSAKDASSVFPSGVYMATIKRVDETYEDGKPMTTKDGHDMQKITFEVYVGSGIRFLSDYHAGGKMLWKYRKLAKALGKEEDFKAERFNAADHVGASVDLTIEIEDNEKYGEQNTIRGYAPHEGAATPPAKPTVPGKAVNAKGIPTNPLDGDDIPF